MKNMVINSLFIFMFGNLFSQTNMEINCVFDCKLTDSQKVDIAMVYKDFSQANYGKNEIFFLVDVVEKDSVNEFYILSSLSIFEALYKRPDCYFKDNEKIVYIFTKDYTQVTDSVWLSKILTETHKTLGTPDFHVSWSNDSIIAEIPGTGVMSVYTYDPLPFKYVVKNGVICSKEIVYQMYYPDDRKPKQIQLYFRTWPYWPNDVKKPYYIRSRPSAIKK